MQSRATEKVYLFFSQAEHERSGAIGSYFFRHVATGEIALVNYVGMDVDGYPASILHGKLVRPPIHETYVRVGEFARDQFQPLDDLETVNWIASKILSVRPQNPDEAPSLFFSQLRHDQLNGTTTDTYIHTKSGAIVNANWIDYQIDGYPGHLENGKVVRPADHDRYILLGQLAPDQFTLLKRNSPTTIETHRPLPAKDSVRGPQTPSRSDDPEPS